MPNYRRSRTPGGTFFFTIVTHERQKILTQPEIRAALRQAITRTQNHHPFTIDAWVLLPDHLHTIWTLPEHDTNYSLRWNMIKQLTSKATRDSHDPTLLSTSRVARRETSLWQRRFWEHHIRNDSDFERCADYTHFNPVKHGLVTRVADWKFSTFHRFVSQGIYAEGWGDGTKVSGDFGE